MSNAQRRRNRRDYLRGFENGQGNRPLESQENPRCSLAYTEGFVDGRIVRETKTRMAAELSEVDRRFGNGEITADERNAAYGKAA